MKEVRRGLGWLQVAVAIGIAYLVFTSVAMRILEKRFIGRTDFDALATILFWWVSVPSLVLVVAATLCFAAGAWRLRASTHLAVSTLSSGLATSALTIGRTFGVAEGRLFQVGAWILFCGTAGLVLLTARTVARAHARPVPRALVQTTAVALLGAVVASAGLLPPELGEFLWLVTGTCLFLVLEHAKRASG